MLVDIKFNLPNPIVSVGNSSKANVKGMGTLYCTAFVQVCDRNIVLSNTLLIPDLMCNELSVNKIQKSGYDVIFETSKEGKGVCSVVTNEDTKVYLLEIQYSDGLHNFELPTANKCSSNSMCCKINTGLSCLTPSTRTRESKVHAKNRNFCNNSSGNQNPWQARL